MQASLFLHGENRLTRSLVGLVVACGISLALGGVALAEAAAPDTLTPTQAAPTLAVTTSASPITLPVAESVSDAKETISGPADSPGILKPVSAVPTEPASVAMASDVSTTMNQSDAGASPASATPVATNSALLVSISAKELPDTLDRPIKPVDEVPIAIVTQQLIPAADGWTLAPADDIMTTPMPQADINAAIATTAASLPPVNAPVIPHGLLTGMSAPMLAGGTVEAAELLASSTNARSLEWRLVLAMSIVILVALSYGLWLRRAGHANAARSDILSSRVVISTPDFLRLFPPLGSRFLVVEQCAWSHLTNRSGKEYAL